MISNFFISCSGANKQILKECPTERAKYAGIGVTIFITGLLAAISGSYFLSFAFSDKENNQTELSWLLLLSFGFLWGILIFNLDRNIILSIKKTGNWKQELRQAWLRIVLAIFIGFVIATPLELKLFEDEVNARVEENLKDQIKEIREKNISIYDADLKNIDEDILKTEIDIKETKTRRNQLYDSFKEEAEGTGGTFKSGRGPVFKEKKSEFDKFDTLYNTFLLKLDTKKAKKDSIFNKINLIDKVDEKNINNINGSEIRIKALYQLSGLHWFITALFILIETLPVISKLMSKRGPYDEILDRIEHEIFLQQQKIISDKNDELNNLILETQQINKLNGESRIKTEKSKLAADEKANESILEDIVKKQSDLAKIILDKWYEDELTKAK